MRKNILNKKVASAAIAGAVVLTMVGSMAYFTDRATTDAKGTAGTVAIELASDINFKDANDMDILNPGDKRDASFSVTNKGNKSVDVRTTVALTAKDHEGQPIAFTGDANTQSEYDLYLASDVELVEGEGYKPKASAKPIAVKSIDNNVIKYVIADYSLNGNSTLDEQETIVGVDTDAHDYDFVLVFKGETGNAWQASTIQMDVIVEAKQHENTGAGWDIVAQESVTQGSLTQDAVMAETVLTPVAP
ncbi:MAG: TasA family protein [Acutalibacteraceae bacterium]|nr:TasA family protein [Acutalibacteraceae bacterium]